MENLYFKVFGQFLWSDEIERAGCFEFFTLPDPATGAVACVRWLPDVGDTQDLPQKPLADLTAEELTAVQAGEAFSLSLAKPSAHRLVIAGATTLEQYGHGSDGVLDLTLRWVLARSFVQGQTICHSAVVLGQPAEPDLGHGFELQLAIPTPAPHGVIDGVSSKAFPFRVHFGGARDAADEPKLLAVGVAAGAEGAASQCKWLDLRTLDPDRSPSHILGEFGFCPYDGGKKYFYFPRDLDAHSTSVRAALWPTDPDRYAKETLGLFAKGASDLRNKIWLPARDGMEQEYQSIGFGHRNGVSQAYFRSAFRPRTGIAGVPKGDIRLVGGRLLPLDPFAVGDCLDNASQAGWTWLDLITEFRLDQGDIGAIARGERDATGFVAIRLGIQQAVNGADGAGVLQPKDDEFKLLDGQIDQEGTPLYNIVTIDKLIDIGLRATRLPRMGLDILSSLEPVTALPDMTLLDGPNNHRFALATDLPCSVATRPITRADGSVVAVSEIRCDIQPKNRKRWPKVDLGLRRWYYDGDRQLEKDPGGFQVTFTLPGIDTASKIADRTMFRALLMPDADIGDPDRVGLITLSLGVDEAAPAGKPFAGRMAGLRLAATKSALTPSGAAANAGHWHFRPGKLAENSGRQIEILAGRNDFLLNLALDAIEPIGVDIPWGDRTGRPRPLLLRVGQGEAGKARYVLSLRDRLARDDDRRLTAEILDGSAGSGKGDGTGTAAGGEDPEKAPSDSRFVLLSEQPFSIMRFEAKSLDARGDAGNQAVASYDSDTRQWSLRMMSRRYRYSLPPQGVGESMDKPRRLDILDPAPSATAATPQADSETVDDGYLRRHAVEYRLTSPTDLWIEPSDLDRNFFLPEWASYEIFRQRGDLGIGAALAGLRAEFLYGLGVSVDPAQERGAAATARVAEIEALLGRPAKKGEQTPANRGWMQKWNRLADAIAHRPERLELWMREPGSAQPFVPARFESGARFALRRRAVLRSPFATPVNDAELHPRLSPHGLPGGVLWPIEARAFCRAFLERPDSTGGTIERIALAPHGGDADFRAEFLNGLLAVIAEVRGGRVQRQRVEIIGRIGAFWHRAKHVVIYERTVSPSAQFTPDAGIGATSRRPVLRKVEEFVELLEPERFYPDSPSGTDAMAGFLYAVRFNSKRIHVDSAWSEDVGTSGWQIPLWNRRSAQTRPSVYPHPDIAFVTHAEGEEDRPLAAQECLDPENLYFYSDAEMPDADTDRWAPVIGVDWVNLPAPSARQQPDLDGGGARDGDTRLPSAPRIPRGYRRFTWRLAPAARRTRLNAGRSGQPLYAALDTLTFSRAVAPEKPDHAAELSDQLASASSGLRPDTAVRAELETLGLAVRTGDPGRIEAAADKFKAAMAKVDLDGLKLGKLNGLRQLAAGEPAMCKKLVDDFAASLDRKKLLLMAQLRAWLEQADAIRVPDAGEPRDAWIKAVVGSIMGEIGPALDDLQADIGRLENDVAKAEAVVSHFEAELFGLFDKAKRKLDETRQAYDDGKPWSPARIESYHSRLEAARAGLIGDISAAVSEIRSRLSTELGRVSHKIGTEVGALLEQVAGAHGDVLVAINQGEQAALTVLGTMRAGYDNRVKEVGAALDAAVAAIAAKPGHEEILEQLDAVGGRLGDALATLDAKLASIDSEIRAGGIDLSGLLATAFDEFDDLLAPFAGQADAIAYDLATIAGQLAAEPELRELVISAKALIAATASKIRGVLDRLASAQLSVLLAVGRAESAALQLLGELRSAYAARVNAARHGFSRAIKAIKSQPPYAAIAQKVAAVAGDLDVASRKLDAKLASMETEVRAGRIALEDLTGWAFDAFGGFVADFAAEANVLAGKLEEIATELNEAPDLRDLVVLTGTVTAGLAAEIDTLLAGVEDWAETYEGYYTRLDDQLGRALSVARRCAGGLFATIDGVKTEIETAFKALKETVKPQFVDNVLTQKVVTPAFNAVISESEFQLIKTDLERARARVAEAVEAVEARLSQLDTLAAAELKQWQEMASGVCDKLKVGIDAIHQALEGAAQDAIAALQPYLALADAIKGAVGDAKELARLIGQAERDFKLFTGAVDRARVQAEAYVDRVLAAVGNITSGGAAAIPNNLLRLYAAAASAPAMPNLDFARERLGYYYDSLKSVIDTTPVEAWFGRLGSELKALGLSLPFERIGESLIPDDLSKLDIGRVFRSFGGVDLSGLFRGYRLPKGAGDAIRVTHAFDPKQARAWVQIEINLAIPGRKSLFSIGPFSLDFVNTRMIATVRLEASKDTDKVEQTGRAALTTTVDAVVSGQSMVALQDMVVRFEQGGGLKVDLDPKKIKLNPAFRFIQQTLGSLFPDEVGGLKLIKQGGLPIGVEHEFSMPPISIMGGTSGVSNIAISNRFALVAFPDFMISNRFALSRPDLPFLFTIFVIGGAGYISVDCEYRPFTSELTVTVEAAAGGSAALGFALGPIAGSVFVSLSVALAYRKQIGRPGGGLRVSIELLIAGRVDVAGLATVNLALLLRMQYHENGRIDGIGTVSVSIRISRFYTYKYRTNANYTLRNGGGGSQAANAAVALARPPVAPSDAAMKRAARILQARA